MVPLVVAATARCVDASVPLRSRCVRCVAAHTTSRLSIALSGGSLVAQPLAPAVQPRSSVAAELPESAVDGSSLSAAIIDRSVQQLAALAASGSGLLSAQRVATELLPTVRRQWDALAQSLAARSTPMPVGRDTQTHTHVEAPVVPIVLLSDAFRFVRSIATSSLIYLRDVWCVRVDDPLSQAGAGAHVLPVARGRSDASQVQC